METGNMVRMKCRAIGSQVDAMKAIIDCSESDCTASMDDGDKQAILMLVKRVERMCGEIRDIVR